MSFNANSTMKTSKEYQESAANKIAKAVKRLKQWEVRFKRREWETVIVDSDTPEGALKEALDLWDGEYTAKDLLGIREIVTVPESEIERLRGLEL